MANKKTTDLSANLSELKKITDWFEEQQEVDIEAGLEKVKEAASLIKSSKARLAEVENEFEEIKREITEDSDDDEGGDEDDEDDQPSVPTSKISEDINPEDIPF
jgi:exonuclease VII small subunit